MLLAHRLGSCLPATPGVLAAIADRCPDAAQALMAHPDLPEVQKLRAISTTTVDDAVYALSVLAPSAHHPASTKALLDKVAESADSGPFVMPHDRAIADFVYAHRHPADIEQLCSVALVEFCPRVSNALVRIGAARHRFATLGRLLDDPMTHILNGDDVLSLLTSAQASDPRVGARLEQVARLSANKLRPSHRALLRLADPLTTSTSGPELGLHRGAAGVREDGWVGGYLTSWGDFAELLELAALHVQTEQRCTASCSVIDGLDIFSGRRANDAAWVAILATIALTGSPNEVHRTILANNLLVRAAVSEAANWVRPLADRIGAALDRPALATYFHQTNAGYRISARPMSTEGAGANLTESARALSGLTTAEVVNTWVALLTLADTWSGSVPELVSTAVAVAAAPGS